MRFRPILRVVICQAIALIGFLLFLWVMRAHAPAPAAKLTAPDKAREATVFVACAEKPVPTVQDRPPLRPAPEPPPSAPTPVIPPPVAPLPQAVKQDATPSKAPPASREEVPPAEAKRDAALPLTRPEPVEQPAAKQDSTKPPDPPAHPPVASTASPTLPQASTASAAPAPSKPDAGNPHATAPTPAPPAPVQPVQKLKEPERFRAPAATAVSPATSPALPAAARRPGAVAEEIVVPPQAATPLGYLTQFKGVEDFHAFLNELPNTRDGEVPTMSLIRIEGLPRDVAEMRRLFKSYRMDPFLFNPKRFNYIITGDLKLLREPVALHGHISALGRYLREETENPACRALRRELVAKAKASKEITDAIPDLAEYDRMEMGLASVELGRFLRKIEADTASQLSQTLGKPVTPRDIARIDCRFRNVNGAVVLVPWQAFLGTDTGRGAIAL